MNEEKNIVVNKTERANSLEIGKAGFRHKIYYDSPQELEQHIKKLKELNLFKEENGY